VIGVALDGMGLGLDDALWGGELLLVEGGINAHQWTRVAHLAPLALPGGDRAAREPWRLAAAILQECGDADQVIHRFAPLVGASESKVVKSALAKPESLRCCQTVVRPQFTGSGRCNISSGPCEWLISRHKGKSA